MYCGQSGYFLNEPRIPGSTRDSETKICCDELLVTGKLSVSWHRRARGKGGKLNVSWHRRARGKGGK